jgi:diguanylate cyclase (GGDEF)-like protein
MDASKPANAEGAKLPACRPGRRSVTAGLHRLGNAAQSLQCKATILVVVLTLGITSAVSGYLLRYSGRLVRAEQDAQLIQSASLLSKAVAVPLAQNDVVHLASLVNQAANGRPLVYVTVFDTSGTTLAAAHHTSVSSITLPTAFSTSSPPTPGTPRTLMADDRPTVILDITYPISFQGNSEDPALTNAATLLGYIRTGILANQWQRSMASRLDLVIGVGAVATLVAIPLGFMVVRRIIAPVEGLADAMSQFADGKLDVQSPVTRRDEIGCLAEAFNRMAEQYRKTHQGLIRLNAELEERVAFRTRQLRELASREPLTGLYNRRHFNEVLQRRFAEAKRYGTDLTAIMIDLDSFKKANDDFGHQLGDDVLVLAATTILSQLRTSDLAARYGGDEFIILLPQTDVQQGGVLAARIMDKFHRELAKRHPDVSVTMSLGIAGLRDLNGPDSDADLLIRTADQAMYDAKSSGKNRIVIAGLVPAEMK